MDIGEIKKQIEIELGKISTEADCVAFHQKFLSKSGSVTLLMAGLRDVAPEKRGEMGAALNELKRDTEGALFKLQKQIKDEEMLMRLKQDKLVDITLPDISAQQGGLHPITHVIRDVEEVFRSMGFIVEDGREIATEYENFESVNVPKDHPARDMQDTFWLDNGKCLRTHTSMWQNHMMKKYGPVFRAICPGRCFRNENIDASHETTFFQVEGMMVDEDVSIANLIYFMKEMTQAIFKKEVKMRLRPGFFPFVEPGFEMDMSCVFCDGKGCPTCKQGGWIELFPCGMIHPKVLEMGGIDPKKYQGFAFGFGLTRLAMMRYGIEDIRLFNSGNLEFLRGVK